MVNEDEGCPVLARLKDPIKFHLLKNISFSRSVNFFNYALTLFLLKLRCQVQEGYSILLNVDFPTQKWGEIKARGVLR